MFAAAEDGYDILHHLFLGKSAYTHEAVYQIPATSEQIVMERRPIHLYLAEYDRTILFRNEQRELIRKAATIDAGGYSKMNLYRISATAYLLCGELSEDKWFLDIESKSIRNIDSDETFYDLTYLGMFNTDKNRKWSFITPDKRSDDDENQTGAGCGHV